ncbi:MAG: 3'-5' exonuclease, partial [Bacteroidota bacterium]
LGGLFATSLQSAGIREDFRSFILSTRAGEQRNTPLYSLFRKRYGQLWERYFERLFNLVGYLPVYDLVAEAYRAFDLFAVQADEEATLVKFLEVIKNFEERGSNSMKDFLAYAEKENDENADEWDIETAGSEDAVRVMTVHKAKGLGFPILITLFYDRVARTDNLFVVGEGDGVQLLRVTGDWAKKSDELSVHYEESRALAQVDDLNKLYVALTRAREEMHILSVRSKRGNQPSAVLPPNGFALGKPSRKQEERQPDERLASTVHLQTSGFAQATGTETIKLRETQRGELIHNILSELEFLDTDVERKVADALEKWKQSIREEVSEDITSTILEFLRVPEVFSYFTPRSGRAVFNELEVVDRSGALHRIDRLVVDAQTVTVVDYKTGEESESYTTQVKDYMEIVRSLYPGKGITGYLLYVDCKVIRGVA